METIDKSHECGKFATVLDAGLGGAAGYADTGRCINNVFGGKCS